MTSFNLVPIDPGERYVQCYGKKYYLCHSDDKVTDMINGDCIREIDISAEDFSQYREASVKVHPFYMHKCYDEFAS